MFNSVDSRRKQSPILRFLQSIYIGYGSDQGGHEPLQVNGGAFINGTVTANAVTIKGLLDLSGAGAGQIKFPATPNLSANANTLDDFEKGTWSPTDGISAGSVGTGTYTKIGNTVIVRGNIAWDSSVNSNGGQAAITGWPFSIINSVVGGVAMSYGTLSTALYGFFTSSSAYSLVNVAGAAIQYNFPIGGTTMHFGGSYTTTQ